MHQSIYGSILTYIVDGSLQLQNLQFSIIFICIIFTALELNIGMKETKSYDNRHMVDLINSA